MKIPSTWQEMPRTTKAYIDIGARHEGKACAEQKDNEVAFSPVCRVHASAGPEVAKLIIAAPQMLEACQSMLLTCGGSSNWNGETQASLKLIEAAILKATGETT